MGAHTGTLFSFANWTKQKTGSIATSSSFQASLPASHASSHNIPPSRAIPCPGITAAIDSRITTYLERPSGLAGGARSVTKIAEERFKAAFKDLDEEQQLEVRSVQGHEKKWILNTQVGAVFAKDCTGQSRALDPSRVEQLEDVEKARAKLCERCANVLSLSAFKNALKVPMPKTLKHVNKTYLHEDLSRIFIKYHGMSDIFWSEDVKVRYFHTCKSSYSLIVLLRLALSMPSLRQC